MCNYHYDKLILDYYKKVAKNFTDRPHSSTQDQFIRNNELKFIEEEIKRYFLELKRNLIILDAGCGNGYTLSVLKENFPDYKLVGIEFSPELYEVAKSRKLDGVKIINGDLRQNNFYEEMVDIVITERVIINILNRKHQLEAIKNISSRLVDGGIYIMIESFLEPLVELNKARKEMMLSLIKESFHNKYLNENFIKNMRKHNLFEITSTLPSNYLSTHFFNTRIIHEIMRPKGGKMKFGKLVDFFDQALPSAVGNFSPILFRIFKKMEK